MKQSGSSNGMIARREMLRRCLRGGALAGLAGVTSWLAARSLHGDCTKSTPCVDCPQFSGCELPKAQTHKQAVEGAQRTFRPGCGEPASSEAFGSLLRPRSCGGYEGQEMPNATGGTPALPAEAAVALTVRP